jgi:hypothetical protein
MIIMRLATAFFKQQLYGLIIGIFYCHPRCTITIRNGLPSIDGFDCFRIKRYLTDKGQALFLAKRLDFICIFIIGIKFINTACQKYRCLF